MTRRPEQEIIEGYIAGTSGVKLARRFGVPSCRVYKLLAAAGVSLRPSGSPKGMKQNPESVRRRAESCRLPLLVRFERHFSPEPNSGCWLWIGATDRRGYGQLRDGGRNRVATHVALELDGRPVPKGMFACHKCDNPSCVNPAHIFIGTQLDNMRDALRKNRMNVSGLEFGRRPGVPRRLKSIVCIHYDKSTNKWRCDVRHQGTKRHVGRFPTQRAAVEAGELKLQEVLNAAA